MIAPALLQTAGTGGADSALPIVFVIIALLIGLVFFIIYVVSLVWVYRDAERRGKSGIVVALLVALISWPIGLLVWLLVRDKV
jgi:Na+-driven multidrug efflux pump